MNCKVTISDAGGKSVNAFGEIAFHEAGFGLKYRLDGDDCEFSVSDSTVSQSRRGAANFDITFKNGEQTLCVLHEGGLSGSVPVKTLRLTTSVREGAALVRIVYLLGGEKFSITLSAVSIA